MARFVQKINMKKITTIIVGFLMIVTPLSVHADVNEQQMIDLLTELVAKLTLQLNYLLAQRGLVYPIIQIQPQATTTPSIIYTTATSTYAVPLENAPARGAVELADSVKPQLWEAQFGADVSSLYQGMKVIRIVTSEPVNLSNTRFRFRNYPDDNVYVERPVTISVIKDNATRDQNVNCSVNCHRVGYESIFEVTSDLIVDVPQRWSSNGQNNVEHSPEFVVSDVAGNTSYPWQSARDISVFNYE